MQVCEGIHAILWRSYVDNNCNTYLIDNDKRILIDPGHVRLLRHVETALHELKMEISDIDVVIATHGHPDHIEGVEKFTPSALFGMNGEEYNLLRQMAGRYIACPEPDFLLQEGELYLGAEEFAVLVTPGHSPASISLYWPKRKALFTGDVVFHQSIGRSDLPGGDGTKLKESIQQLSALDVDYLLPGHGEIVQGKDAVQENFRKIKDYWFRYL